MTQVMKVDGRIVGIDRLSKRDRPRVIQLLIVTAVVMVKPFNLSQSHFFFFFFLLDFFFFFFFFLYSLIEADRIPPPEGREESRKS